MWDRLLSLFKRSPVQEEQNIIETSPIEFRTIDSSQGYGSSAQLPERSVSIGYDYFKKDKPEESEKFSQLKKILEGNYK